MQLLDNTENKNIKLKALLCTTCRYQPKKKKY